MLPSATMVTPLAPVRAVKKAQEHKAAIANPPGSHPSNASMKFMIRWGAFVSVSRQPTKVNSGRATRTGMDPNRFISIRII